MTAAENLALAIEFMEAVFNRHEFDAADKYLAPDLIEHNSNERDGLDEFKKSMPKLLAETPKGSWVLARSVAEENMVWLHSKIPIHGKDYAIVDIFRMEGGKIVEHWDVLQEMIPSTVNSHPYF